MKSFKKRSLLSAIFILFLTFSVSSAFAQIQQTKQIKTQPETYTMTGKAINAQTGEAITDATVILVNTGATAKTNAEGTFSFQNLKAGSYAVIVKADGYKAWKQQVEVNADKDLKVKLKPEAK